MNNLSFLGKDQINHSRCDCEAQAAEIDVTVIAVLIC
jgi:hypothetical protein